MHAAHSRGCLHWVQAGCTDCLHWAYNAFSYKMRELMQNVGIRLK